LILGAMSGPLASQERTQTRPPEQTWPPAQSRPQDIDRAQDKGTQEGVEVQARGEVHEAFAQPSLAKQRPSPIVRKQPPEPVNELPPDQKTVGDNVQWIPGYWSWDQDRSDFLWVSGTWRDVPPERRWVPGYWTKADDGWRWVTGYWNDHKVTSVEIYSAPPEPIEEAMPAPEADRTYVPGNWVNRTNQWWWRPGFWVTYRPGWCWVNAGYWWTPAGYVFIDGYWDYDLEHRGICFAPAIIARDYYLRQGWYYRPRYVIAADFFYGSLFVNSGWNHYYFGDYYDPRYVGLGYQPWVTIGAFDPLFSYYHWRHRDDPRWERDIQGVFTGRRDGSMARPPRTLALLERAGAGQVRGGTTIATATPIVALEQFKPTDMKLQRITETQQRELQTSVTRSRTLGQERSRLETGATRSSLAQPIPGEGREAVPPGAGRKDTIPETGRKETIPEQRKDVVPPDARKDTGRREPPIEQGKEVIPEQRREVGREPIPSRQPVAPPSRVELPKSEQIYRAPQADRSPPPRPSHPEPRQQPEQRKPPEKTPGKPGG
jgi:hypothetical protein